MWHTYDQRMYMISMNIHECGHVSFDFVLCACWIVVIRCTLFSLKWDSSKCCRENIRRVMTWVTSSSSQFYLTNDYHTSMWYILNPQRKSASQGTDGPGGRVPRDVPLWRKSRHHWPSCLRLHVVLLVQQKQVVRHPKNLQFCFWHCRRWWKDFWIPWMPDPITQNRQTCS